MPARWRCCATVEDYPHRPLRGHAREGAGADNINSLAVTDALHIPGRFTGRCVHHHLIALLLLEQGPRHGRVDRDVIVAPVDLVIADNAKLHGLAIVILDLDPGTKKHLAFLFRRVGHHLHIFKPLAQVTHPAVDFAQQLLVVLVLSLHPPPY